MKVMTIRSGKSDQSNEQLESEFGGKLWNNKF